MIREVEENFRSSAIDAFIGNATDWEKVCVGNLVGMPLVVVPTGFKNISHSENSNNNSTTTRRRTTVTTGIYAPPERDHIVSNNIRNYRIDH